MGEKLKLHRKLHGTVYVFVAVLLFVGVIFGSIVASGEQPDIGFYLQQFFGQLAAGDMGQPFDIWQESYLSHLAYIGVMWLLGISVIGLPFILLLLFLKGVALGFAVGVFIKQWGTKGFLLSVASVLPQNIIVLPVYLVVGVASVNFSIRLVRVLLQREKGLSASKMLKGYTLLFVFVGVLLAASAMIEGYVSPILMKMVWQ